MEQFLAFPIELIPYLIVTLMIAFTVHEFAHAYVAYLLGDPTAKNEGRLTLSPLSHLDVLGTLMIFLLGFGWAKPVPVNQNNFRYPRISGILVSFAGPLSNVILMCLGFLIWFLLLRFGIEGAVEPAIYETIYLFFNTFILLNLILAIFNLLPFPPLDGYRMLENAVSPSLSIKMKNFESYGVILFLILVLTPLDQYTITPIFNKLIPYIFSIMENIFSGLVLV
ncbi:site-2 protease family protein [Bacillus solimangrovi]|uniref:Zinc metalloprotease n=1 Tax=Bacillus solimangrovi TaxID=1305675 RepID=A0A1E5LEB0_9BACI|nr:site-2 protease family protein [Bacillus solimangrovi]OEH92402.1 zinc metalloprotease [Bacillus solimangrovi]